MNPKELQGKYARLSAELASLEGSGAHSKARQVRLELELDQIDQQLAAFRRVAKAAPNLRDVVMTADWPRDHEGPLHRASALRIFPDAEHVEGSQIEAEQRGHIGWRFAAGLASRSDGVMAQPSRDR